jgi:hypothetical protein
MDLVLTYFGEKLVKDFEIGFQTIFAKLLFANLFLPSSRQQFCQWKRIFFQIFRKLQFIILKSVTTPSLTFGNSIEEI